MDTIVDPPVGTESDHIPQPIWPKYYYVPQPIWPYVVKTRRYPHPVLCSKEGVIKYLPDHMHEGLCEVPSDLTKSFTFDGLTVKEYPSKGGHQEVPEVIAQGQDRNSGGAFFGVIGAYNGHNVGVGRVVVDSTWHHWFNINLRGFENATTLGHPTYDAAVIPKWEAIKSYFRNVGTWLARPSEQSCLRHGGLLTVLADFDVRVNFRKLDTVISRFKYLLYLGIMAKDALGRRAPQCQQKAWILVGLPRLERWVLDPWILRPKPRPRPEPDPLPFIDPEMIETVMLGSMIQALGEEFLDVEHPQRLLDRSGAKIEKALDRGIKLGSGVLAEEMAQAAKGLQPLVKDLEALR